MIALGCGFAVSFAIGVAAGFWVRCLLPDQLGGR